MTPNWPETGDEEPDPALAPLIEAGEGESEGFELAEENGISLIEMALAFVIRHPAVTAAIIGPRTMEHLESQLTAADVTLSDEVLDRIDEIVPPGTNLNPGDAGYVPPALESPELRRRPVR